MIVELVQPGLQIDLTDRKASSDMEWQVMMLVSSLYEANAALIMFNEVRGQTYVPEDIEKWPEEAKRKRELLRQVIDSQHGLDDVSASQEAEVLWRREQWSTGRLPLRLRIAKPFVAAKGFLFAADNIEKQIATLASATGAPASVAGIHAQVGLAFPSLRELRNSAHHLEDRARGLDRKGRKLDLKPVNAGGIAAPGGALVIGNLNGSTFGCTLKDGSFGQIDVTEGSLAKLGDIVQNVLDALPWKGPRTYVPY